MCYAEIINGTSARRISPLMSVPLEKAINRWVVALRTDAGAVGFEPTNGGSKNRCLTTWRHPSLFCVNKTEHKDRVFRDFWQRKSQLGVTDFAQLLNSDGSFTMFANQSEAFAMIQGIIC